MLIIKKTAKAQGLRPEMDLAVQVINDCFAHWGYDCVITEITGSKHGRGSLHYVGQAIDFRVNNIHGIDREKIVAKIKENLNDQYDVILEEYSNSANDHIHCEFQPK